MIVIKAVLTNRFCLQMTKIATYYVVSSVTGEHVKHSPLHADFDEASMLFDQYLERLQDSFESMH